MSAGKIRLTDRGKAVRFCLLAMAALVVLVFVIDFVQGGLSLLFGVADVRG